MEVIVLSPEVDQPNELDWVRRLFEAGLTRFHVRKPGKTDLEVRTYLQRIPADFHHRLVLHQCHGLVVPMGLGGWHFKDDAGMLAGVGETLLNRGTGRSCSRSVHQLEELSQDTVNWDYVFLSPVFPSISKPGHGPAWSERQLSRALQGSGSEGLTRVFALGGVDETRLEPCQSWGFDGVALLGAIWQARNPLDAYLSFQQTLGLGV